MKVVFVGFFVFLVAGCGTAPKVLVVKPDVSEATRPSEQACEKPGEWLIRSGRWTCAQPRRVRVPVPMYSVPMSPLDEVAARRALGAYYWVPPPPTGVWFPYY